MMQGVLVDWLLGNHEDESIDATLPNPRLLSLFLTLSFLFPALMCGRPVNPVNPVNPMQSTELLLTQ